MAQHQLDHSWSLPKANGFQSAVKWLGRHWRPVLLLGLVVWGGWQFFVLHVDDPTGYSSPATVQDYTGFAPPASAAHIRTAGFSQLMAFGHFVRFEAPVKDCLAYAQKVAHGMPLTVHGGVRLDPLFIQAEQKYLPNLSSWFDLPSAANIVGASPGADVWVDQSRGVFYFYEGF